MNVLDLKAAVRARDGNCCTECGMTAAQHVATYRKALHVHRLDPGSRYSVDRCVTLCLRCHGSKPKAPKGTPNLYRSGLPLHVYLPASSRHAIDALRKKNRRSLTEEVSIALEKHLTELGYWPPADDATG